MNRLNLARAARAALIAAAIGANTTAFADIKDYTFELIDQTVQADPTRTSRSG